MISRAERDKSRQDEIIYPVKRMIPIGRKIQRGNKCPLLRMKYRRLLRKYEALS